MTQKGETGYGWEQRKPKNSSLSDFLQMVVLLALLAAFLGGCVSLAPARYVQDGVEVIVTDGEEVDRACRAEAPNLAIRYRHATILGCYLIRPGRNPRIYSNRDPETLAHEWRHHREGAFHK